MLGIHPRVMSPKLEIFKEAWLFAKKKTPTGEERRQAKVAEVKKLEKPILWKGSSITCGWQMRLCLRPCSDTKNVRPYFSI